MRTQINTIADKFNTEIADQVSTAAKFGTDANDRILDTIVDVNRKAVDFAVKTAEKINTQITEQAPTLELPFELPMADRFEMPTPAEAGKRYIDVVERLAEMNRDFSERMVAMLPADKPVVTKPVAEKAAAKKAAAARKPAAKKAPAKKKASARKAAAKK